MSEFRVIVAGSRGFNDYPLLANKLHHLLKEKVKTYEIVIVSGTAQGADKLGEMWASRNGHRVERFPADWNQFGKRAGYLRNEDMARYADAAVVFWDGQSRGSKHMIDIMEKLNKSVRIVRFMGRIIAPDELPNYDNLNYMAYQDNKWK